MNSSILKSPVLSEKAYKHMEKSVYTFMVDLKSDKKQIAKIVERHFGVNVTKVNVAKKSQKTKRIANTRKEVLTGGGKKATVWLVKGQTISTLSPKTEKKEKKEAKTVKKTDDKKESKGLISRFKKADKKETK